jgi:hypothetical protein
MRKPLEWFRTLKQKAKHDQYISGFDYTIGAIVRGEKTPLELDAEQIDCHRSQFDVGMDNAIDYAVQHGLIKDDRI